MSDANRAIEIFNEARKLQGAERAAFLDRACANDPALREKIDGLLRAEEHAGDFLGGTQTEQITSDAAPISESPGTRIGPYKLLEQIGEGGFGTVFMAEQEHPVRRRVALKIIKLGMDTRQVVARFEQERQALAILDHPNIAKVFDAGATENGRPYFVMELCIGESITDYCDKHNLSISDRLELFVQVCQAVQHAHQKGLIHRDIKPSNVLVSTQDGKPHAKVIDFGVAKATSSKLTEKTLFTAHKTLVGTPEYMSPEQAEGSLDIDTRTDVYALGVMLYELLTGATPFDAKKLRSAAYAEIQRIIREDDPPNPSTRLSQNSETIASVAARRQTEPRKLGTIVRGELDWIVMKALEKNRQRRYETAVSLGQDVQRYLAGEAVVAAPVSRVYRFRKVVARNKGKVSAGAAVSAALLIGLIASAWQATIARARAAELKQVADFQAHMLSQIDATDAGVRLMANIRAKFAAALTKLKLPDAERVARMNAFDLELSQVNATDTAAEMIDAAILKPAISAIDAQFKTQPLVDASLRYSVADVYEALGDYDDAETQHASALATRRRALGDADPATLASLNRTALALMSKGKPADAEKMFREAVTGNSRVLGADHLQSIAATRNLGTLYVEAGRFAEAEPLLSDAMERSRRVLGNDNRETLVSINSVANLLNAKGKLVEAEPLAREVYERGERTLGADDPDLLIWIGNLGVLLQDQGRRKDAEPYFREAMEKYRRVRGEAHPLTIRAMAALASNLNLQSKYAESEALYRDALTAAKRVFGPTNPYTNELTRKVGWMLMNARKYDDAEPFIRDAFNAEQLTRGELHPQTLAAQGLYGRLLVQRGEFDRAEKLLRDASDKSTRAFGADHPETLIKLADLADALAEQRKFDEAGALFRNILDTRRRISGPTHPNTLVEQATYAMMLQTQKKYPEAEALIRNALVKYRATLGDDHEDTVRSMVNLASVLGRQSKFAEAEPLYREAIAAYERSRGKDYAGIVNIRVRLGEALTGLNRFPDAETELLTAQRAIDNSPETFRRARQPNFQALIALYESWDKADPDKGHDTKAVEWKAKLDALNAATQPTTTKSSS